MLVEDAVITMIVIPLIAAAIGSALTVIFRPAPDYSMFREAVEGWRSLTRENVDNEHRQEYVEIESARLLRLIHQHPAITVLSGTEKGPKP